MDEGELDIRQVLGLLRRQARVIVVTFVLVLSVAVLVIATLKPAYTATALVLVDPSRKNLLIGDQPLAGTASDGARVDSEVEIIETEAILRAAALSLDLPGDPRFGNSPGWREQFLALFGGGAAGSLSPEAAADLATERLRDAISVQRRGLTYLIAINARAADPALAARLANGVAEAYIVAQIGAKIDGTLAARDIVQARIADANATLVAAEAAFDNFVAAVAPEAGGDVAGLYQELREADIVVSGAEVALASAATGETDALRREVSVQQAQAGSLREALRGTIASGALTPALLTDIYALQQKAGSARRQYQALLDRQQELSTQAYLQVADSRVVSAALPPGDPSFPNARLFLALAGLGALGLGVGLAFLNDRFVGGFTSAAQLATGTRMPVVSEIPRQRPRGPVGETASVADLLVDAPLSHYAEAVRRIRVGVDRAMRRRGDAEGPGGVVMVSSSAPGEGKTTTALALARAYAAAGRATLLIDGDLRQPSVHRQLGIERPSGLLDYLADDTETIKLPSILAVDPKSPIRLALGAHRSDFPTDQLVTGQAFARLVEAARRSFDIVVIDTPPIGAVVDGLYLAEYADVVLMVVRWASTPQPEVKTALANLREAARPGVEILTVLNQADGAAAAPRGAYDGYFQRA